MSDMLLRPDLDPDDRAGDDRALRWELPDAPPARRDRTRLRRVLAGAVLVGAALAATLALPPVELAQAGSVQFDDDATHLTVEQFDERGVYSLRYVHGEHAEVRVPVRNDGWLPTTVTGISFDGRPAPMIDPIAARGTPVELAPGEETTLAVYVRFDNCEYYTERALDVYRDVTVTTRTVGVDASSTVRLDHDLVVRSPMMTTCPDRVSDRGAFLRGG